MEKIGVSEDDIKHGGMKGISKKTKDTKKLAEELGIGEPTLVDIVKELEKPGRDPREEMPKPILRSDVLDERFKTGYGAERNGAECDRLWCVCRYRCASGWTRAYFPDVRQIHQASAGGCIGWRYRGCDGNEC